MDRGRGISVLPIGVLLVSTAVLAAPTPRPSAGCARETIVHGRRLVETIEVDGRKRQYILDVPESVRAGTPVPLLFDFHGFGHSGAGVWMVSEFKDLAARDGFITVYPEGVPVRLRLRGQEHEGPGWEIDTIEGNRDLAFVRALLDDLERRYCIDTARVYSTGFSNGAFFSSVLGCALADRIAAVAPVSGGALRTSCTPARGVPVLIQHGRQDELIPVSAAQRAREQWLAANGCTPATKSPAGEGCERWTQCRDGAVVEYCEGDFAHRWPPGATDRVWRFLSTQTRQ